MGNQPLYRQPNWVSEMPDGLRASPAAVKAIPNEREENGGELRLRVR